MAWPQVLQSLSIAFQDTLAWSLIATGEFEVKLALKWDIGLGIACPNHYNTIAIAKNFNKKIILAEVEEMLSNM